MDSIFLLNEPKVWAAPFYGGVHDLREDRDLWPILRFLPGASMSQGTYAVSFFSYYWMRSMALILITSFFC